MWHVVYASRNHRLRRLHSDPITDCTFQTNMQRVRTNVVKVEERLSLFPFGSGTGKRRPRQFAHPKAYSPPLRSFATLPNPSPFHGWERRQLGVQYHWQDRPFSSATPSQPKSMEDVLRQTTRRVVEHPVGSMPTSLWSEAHSSILSWLALSTSESVIIPLELLNRLVQEEVAATQGVPHLPEFYSVDLLNLIVNHWRKILAENVELRRDPSLHPEKLIHRLVEYHQSSSNGSSVLQPNTQSFAMLIDGAALFVDGPSVADHLVEWIIEEAPTHPHMQPNVYTFSSLMNVWVKSKDPAAPERVETILDLMHDLHLEFPGWGVAPNQVTYTTAIDVWAKLGRVDRAEQLLHDMHVAYKQSGMEWLKPNLPAFNGLLVALARAGETDRAQKVLEQIEALYESGELDDSPSVISYSTVLSAFAKSSKAGSARRAEQILRQMKDRGVRPNVISWNTVIDAYAKEKDPERAESLLREMNHDYEQGINDVKPTMRTYSSVLSAWSANRSPQSGERGEQLLDLMAKLYTAGEMDEPDVVVYNSVLACWASSRTPGAGVRAKEFLEKMIRERRTKPDIYSFNTVMSALVREGRLVDAENIFAAMRENDVKPDATAYNTLLNAWIKSGAKDTRTRVESLYQRMKEDPDAKPDLFTMNTLLHFYSKSNNPEGAEDLLRELCLPESTMKPDSVSFNIAISAWTSSKRLDAPGRAEAILSRMSEYGEKAAPNVITFNSIMNAWVKSRPLEALQECKRLVGTMFDLVEQGNDNAQPNVITYNTLIHAHCVSGDHNALLQADTIFREMDRRYEQGDVRLKPTFHTYGSLINGWSKSKNPEAGRKAEDILRLWIERADVGEVSERPQGVAFSATIQAYTNSGDPQAAYRADAIMYLLLREFKNGNQGCKPDKRVFVVALKALVASRVHHKAKAARRLVEMMKEYKILPDRENVELLKKCLT